MSLWDQLLPVSGELWMVGWVDVVPLDVNVHVPVGPAAIPVSGELWMVGWVDVVPLDVDVHVPMGPAVTCKW
jgi:hypothetical protein